MYMMSIRLPPLDYSVDCHIPIGVLVRRNPGLATESQFKIEQLSMAELKKEIGNINILKS